MSEFMTNIKKELKKYIKENMIIINKRSTPLSKLKNFFAADYSVLEEASIESYINTNKEYNNFQNLLFKYIDDRNLKDSDVYNKVHIDRRLFSKIRSDNNYHPSKETVLLLAISLELSIEELEELLKSASYSLPKNNEYDLIIRFCFINKIFKLTDINEFLDDYNCKVFN